MKYILIMLFSLPLINTVNAQNRNIYFLKNNGKLVSIKDSADFIRIIQEPDSGTTYYKVMEYYPDEVQKFIGTVSVFEPHLIYEGANIAFHKNGKRAEVITYQKGVPSGSAYYFYPDGKLKKTLEYGNEGMKRMMGYQNVKYKVTNYFDTAGVQLVKDGNGYTIETVNNDKITEEGGYVSGVRNGLWKTTNSGNSLYYEDIYNNGEFVSGKNFSPDGKVIVYTQKDVLPKFKGGINQFSQFLSYHIKYPSDAKQDGITGRVLLSFVVEKDGTLTNIKVLNSIYPSLDEEALRVLHRSPKWEPGMQNGVPVKVQYTIPIVFKL
ncbi:MAG TPA: TonB family protein [Sphingobacteriaceae bacterium]|nr:TonB family protein [Sphingobacteriaceae bacterium]